LSKSVGRFTGSETELRERETKGGERCMSKNIKVERVEGDLLSAQYKIGRKMHKETFDWMELEDAKNDLLEGLAGDSLDTLDCAIHYPEYYWCFYFHTNGKVNEFMSNSGILNNKKRK
jgi:hypothetical protein